MKITNKYTYVCYNTNKYKKIFELSNIFLEEVSSGVYIFTKDKYNSRAGKFIDSSSVVSLLNNENRVSIETSNGTIISNEYLPL